MATLYEINLACGDTISSRARPRIGAYRKCIHCDTQKQVTDVIAPPDAGGPRDPELGPDRVYVPDCAMVQDQLF